MREAEPISRRLDGRRAAEPTLLLHGQRPRRGTGRENRSAPHEVGIPRPECEVPSKERTTVHHEAPSDCRKAIVAGSRSLKYVARGNENRTRRGIECLFLPGCMQGSFADCSLHLTRTAL